MGSILIASLLSTGRAEPADEQPRANQQPVTNAAVVTVEEKRPSPIPLAPVYAMALAGDLQEALRILETVPVDTLNSRERTARENLLRTFVEKKLPPIEVPDPFVAELIGIYRDYWMRVLLRELNVAEGKEYLFKRLTAILGQAGYHNRPGTLERGFGPGHQSCGQSLVRAQHEEPGSAWGAPGVESSRRARAIVLGIA